MVRRLVPILAICLAAPRAPAQASAGPLELGEAAGRPGETVEVSVRATFERPLSGLFAVFLFDPARLEYLRYDVRGSAAQGVPPTAVGFRTYEPGEGGFGIHDGGDLSRGVTVPPGERQLLGKLLFRIRALAEAGAAEVRPVERIPTTGAGTALYFKQDREWLSAAPSSLVPGGVTVLPPAGPRPVGDLRCEQYLDRALISFSLSGQYDAIEVARDGEVIAVLPAAATRHTDPLPGVGRFAYAVTGILRGERSVPATCEVFAVAPAAPPVRDLSCGDAGLTWSSPIDYDSVVVLRNGEPIAELPGRSTSFTDPDRPDALTVYTVLGVSEGFRSPEVHCLDHGLWILEVGDVLAPLDAEEVLVPVCATTPIATAGFEAHLEIELDRLTYRTDPQTALEGTVLHPRTEGVYMGMGWKGLPSVGVIFDAFPPIEPEKQVPAGLRQLVFRFPFRPSGAFADGESLPASIGYGSFVAYGPAGTAGGAMSYSPDLVVPGEVRFGTGGPAPVRGLAAAVDEGASQEAAPATDVVLSWQNGSWYEQLRLERNGSLLAELGGGATSYRDARVPAGVFTYKVSGVQAARRSFPASAFLSTLSPPGAFLRGDSTGDGKVDLADPVATLNYLFRGGDAPPCEDAADANDDGRIAITDPVITLQHLFLGGGLLPAPGTAYPWLDPTPDALGCGG
ncbi:MAG: hypothetical protein HY721_19010 [Planctomycetes bacterium]|nr:hypothetical protein [Planctomycetota bacterium]